VSGSKKVVIHFGFLENSHLLPNQKLSTYSTSRW